MFSRTEVKAFVFISALLFATCKTFWSNNFWADCKELKSLSNCGKTENNSFAPGADLYLFKAASSTTKDTSPNSLRLSFKTTLAASETKSSIVPCTVGESITVTPSAVLFAKSPVSSILAGAIPVVTGTSAPDCNVLPPAVTGWFLKKSVAFNIWFIRWTVSVGPPWKNFFAICEGSSINPRSLVRWENGL